MFTEKFVTFTEEEMKSVIEQIKDCMTCKRCKGDLGKDLHKEIYCSSCREQIKLEEVDSALELLARGSVQTRLENLERFMLMHLLNHPVRDPFERKMF